MIWPSGLQLNVMYSCRNHFRIRQEFLNTVFYKLACCIYMQVLFLSIFEIFVFFFYNVDVSKFMVHRSNLVGIYIFIWNWFNKIFLVKFNHSSVYFCYLKNCAGFFGKPYSGCLCLCCRIAISLVNFVRESYSLVKKCRLLNLV